MHCTSIRETIIRDAKYLCERPLRIKGWCEIVKVHASHLPNTSEILILINDLLKEKVKK